MNSRTAIATIVSTGALLACSGDLLIGGQREGGTGAIDSGEQGVVDSGSTGTPDSTTSTAAFDSGSLGTPDSTVATLDSTASVVGLDDGADWPLIPCNAISIPAEVVPIPPTMSVSQICSSVTSPPQWNSEAGAPGNVNADGRSVIVGRWASCNGNNGAPPLIPSPHAGIEFGANGRWQLLDTDATGALVPATAGTTSGTTRGYYYATGDYGAWENLSLDSDPDSQTALQDFPSQTAFVSLQWPVGLDVMVAIFTTAGNVSQVAYYARAQPSPLNGSDNPPPVADGACSLVGTWDVPAVSEAPEGAPEPPAAFTFDGAGNFTVRPKTCATETMFGTYYLSSYGFALTEASGMGGCLWSNPATYNATFNADCTQLTLSQVNETCVQKNRNYLGFNTTVITKTQ